jgi:hypothetical protein
MLQLTLPSKEPVKTREEAEGRVGRHLLVRYDRPQTRCACQKERHPGKERGLSPNMVCGSDAGAVAHGMKGKCVTSLSNL